MKILHLGKLCPLNEGGIELFSYDLLEYLNSKGIKADLLCFGDRSFNEQHKGFNYFSCKTNVKLNSALLSYDFFKSFKKIVKNYDLIHIHTPNPLADILSLTSHKRIIIHWHSDIVRQKILYNFYKPIQQKVLKKANKIICTSPQYLESSVQLKRFKKKAVIIPSGLDIKRLNSDFFIDENLNRLIEKIKNRKIILSIGRLVEYKGFEYLIESGKYIQENTVILIAGGGALYNKLINKVKSLNLEKKVYILGRVEKIQSFIKLCDVFCLPSIDRNEAFGLVLVEALKFKKPLVTTDIKGSGMNYVNKEGITGLVVPPRNPKALAEAFNRILSDEVLYNNFSKNSGERFNEFEISNIGNAIINLYKEVINC